MSSACAARVSAVITVHDARRVCLLSKQRSHGGRRGRVVRAGQHLQRAVLVVEGVPARPEWLRAPRLCSAAVGALVGAASVIFGGGAHSFASGLAEAIQAHLATDAERENGRSEAMRGEGRWAPRVGRSANQRARARVEQPCGSLDHPRVEQPRWCRPPLPAAHARHVLAHEG